MKNVVNKIMLLGNNCNLLLGVQLKKYLESSVKSDKIIVVSKVCSDKNYLEVLINITLQLNLYYIHVCIHLFHLNPNHDIKN